ncbi:MAG: class I SAM-dependent methyltransferase [Dokdonella sp.]
MNHDWRKRRSADDSSPDFLTPFLSVCRFCECGESHHRILGEVPLTFSAPLAQQGYRLAQCGECEVVYLDPEPPADDLDRLYVGSIQFSDTDYMRGAQADRTARGYARRLHYLDLLPETVETILEIGAGPAWICRAAKERRSDVVTIAQDISDECVAHCPWVDHYILGNLSQLQPNGSIQLAAMTHVIEHLPKPADFLCELTPYLAPGGKVYITAPHRPALWRPEQGFGPWLDYSYLHVPAHISYLSEKWMRGAAAKAGLKMVRWDTSVDGYQVFEAILEREMPSN